MKILSFGEIIWDIYPDCRAIGGAPLNFAGHCSIGGHQAFMLSAVGSDDLGQDALRMIDTFGINSDFVSQNDKKTGQCIVTLDEKGIPSYKVLDDTAYDNISCVNIVKLNAMNFDAFYFGTLAQKSAVSRRTLENILAECTFDEVFCDLNLRDGCYDEQSVKNCLSHATILKFSDEEAPRLEIYEFWQKMCDEGLADSIFSMYKQIKVILLTKGSDGSQIYTRNGECYEIPATGDKVVSTVGAGDSFGAVWLCRYLSGDSVKKTAEIASRVSGYVVSQTDALPSYNISDFI